MILLSANSLLASSSGREVPFLIQGEDAVVECVEEDGRIKAYRSWNFNTPKKTNRRASDHSGIHNVNGAYINGVMYCSYELDPVFQQNGVTLDLNKQKYVPFVAAGYIKDGEDARVLTKNEQFKNEPKLNDTTECVQHGSTSKLSQK